MSSIYDPTDTKGIPDKASRETAMWLHICMLFGGITGFISVIVFFVLWLTKREEMPWINQHGKNIINWAISLFVYALVPAGFYVVGGLIFAGTMATAMSNQPYAPSSAPPAIGLAMVMIGIGYILLGLLGLTNLIYSIMNAVKASKGEMGQYPSAINLYH